MIAPPRCTVDGCTATALHHHPLVSLGRGSGRYRRLEQRPEQWTECNGCCPGYDEIGAVRPPYRYPAPLRDLQRWSDLPEGRVWITRRTSAGREAQGQTQTRNRYDRKGWEVSWRVGDTRRRYCLPSFEQAVTFARVGMDTHALVVS